MKLNNRGWGLGVLIAFLCVFFLAIVIIGINASKMGLAGNDGTSNKPITNPSQNNNSTSNNTDNSESNQQEIINNYETQLKEVAKNYLKAKNIKINESDSLTITISHLIRENYINHLKLNNTDCSGYIIIKNENKKLKYNPYVFCESIYQTEGYQSVLDESIKD